MDGRYGIVKELRTPGAKQQAVRKMDGLLTVPPMAQPAERLFIFFSFTFYTLVAAVRPARAQRDFNKRDS